MFNFKEDMNMASNPIQRRARQSFLVGFLIALIIMAIVVALLFMKINSLNEEIEAMVVTPVSVYILADDVKSGDVITSDMLVYQELETVNSIMDTGNYLTPSSLEEYDESTGEAIKYYSKIDIPAGSVMLDSMIYAENEEITDDQRIIEYGMLVLPSQLSNGDYIDIRFQLPTGRDEIVLSRKRVEQCTETSIWLNMDEMELLLMNSAIVDSYLTTGSMLYATLYTEPGMQSALITNYAPSDAVLTAINYDPNIVNEAVTALINRWESLNLRDERTIIDGYSSDMDADEKASTVESARQEEIQDIATKRSEYVSELEGTGLVGTTY
jgi:hypothetical protein